MKRILYTALVAWMVSCLSGCQNLQHWWHNEKRVGPNYRRPAASVQSDYQDANSPLIDNSTRLDPEWWHVFGDPELTSLIEHVYQQNLSLKAVSWRIAEARAQRNIVAANLFPQQQQGVAQFSHTQNSVRTENAFPGFPVTIDNWNVGFDASWELDLWGRIRRGIDAADASYQAVIHDYDFLLVSLVADTATLYVQIRSLDERLQLARQNVELQQGSLAIAERRFEEGRTSKLDVVQAESNLAATQGLIPRLELARRQSMNALAILLGTTPDQAGVFLSPEGRLPEIPPAAVVGIPAELLLARPDVRAAERRLAAQFEQIGIAEAEFYPTLAITGTLGWQAGQFSDLFESGSFNGTIAPGFRWKLLNYGRLANGVRVEEARVQAACFEYQNAVLAAQREVEDGIVEFIKSSEQFTFDQRNERANREAVELATVLFREGQENFNRVFVVQTNLVQAQDQLVSTRAGIALAMIKIYRALGDGWQIRCPGVN